MNKRTSLGLVLLALISLPACGTVNGVRWAYGMTSVYGKPDAYAESEAIRATFGAPTHR